MQANVLKQRQLGSKPKIGQPFQLPVKGCDNVHRDSSLLSSKYSKPFHKSTALAQKNYFYNVSFGFLTKFYLYPDFRVVMSRANSRNPIHCSGSLISFTMIIIIILS